MKCVHYEPPFADKEMEERLNDLSEVTQLVNSGTRKAPGPDSINLATELKDGESGEGGGNVQSFPHRQRLHTAQGVRR